MSAWVQRDEGSLISDLRHLCSLWCKFQNGVKIQMKEHGTGMPADVLWGLELKRISYLCLCENNLIKLICYNIFNYSIQNIKYMIHIKLWVWIFVCLKNDTSSSLASKFWLDQKNKFIYTRLDTYHEFICTIGKVKEWGGLTF